MEVGTALLWLCMGATLVSAAAYVASAFDNRKLPIARLAYYAMTTGVVMASAYLLNLILIHDFNAQYVFSYTSRTLPKVYLISAFWAGQEGSFLLWALLGSIIGMVLAVKSKDYEPWVMAFWSCVQAFFFTLLLVKSPFAQTPAEMLMRFPDGQGLNPLLQNFWIAVHPPMIYVGYAAMAVPAAFVVAGLIRKDYTGWSNRCLPWALFGWLTLGAGIILGSYWAYEVLGWGGYWGWDPVENASLVPWIAATALVHGLLVERYRGSMRRTNIALALISFLLVVYATYLTRSGVLGDFSVHSFEASGTNVYLMGFLVFFTLLSVVIYAWRGRTAPSNSWYGKLISKEFAFFVGIITFSVLALLVLFGTSSPLITMRLAGIAGYLQHHLGSFGASSPVLLRLASLSPTAAGQSFYGLVSAPASLVILLALTLVPLLAWAKRGESEKESVGGSLRVVMLLLAAVLVVAALIACVRGLNAGVLVAVGSSALLALIVNGWAAYRYGAGNWKMLGGYLSHIGMALMFIGMVFSPSIQTPARLIIPQGNKGVRSTGYNIQFLEAVERTDGVVIRLKIEKNGKSFIAQPEIRPTNDGAMRAPYIKTSLTQDLYIAPVQIKVPEIEPSLKMTPQGMQFLPATTPDGGATVRLMKMQVENKTVILLVEEKGQRPVAVTLAQGETKQAGKYNLTFNGFHLPAAHTMGNDMEVGAKVSVDYPGVGPSAVIEVSVKKLIGLLWLGAILTLTGGVIAIVRRVGENRKLVTASDEETSGIEDIDRSHMMKTDS